MEYMNRPTRAQLSSGGRLSHTKSLCRYCARSLYVILTYREKNHDATRVPLSQTLVLLCLVLVLAQTHVRSILPADMFGTYKMYLILARLRVLQGGTLWSLCAR